MQTLNRLFFVLITLCFIVSCSSDLTNKFIHKQKIKLDSIPSESNVYIDGKFYGKTPMELDLQSDISHEIHFKKNGFKPSKEFLHPVYKNRKKPYIQFGFAKDLGYYSKLSSDQIIANLEWEFLPESYGITPFCDMSKLTIKADKSLSLGEISLEEHEIILKQIIDLFHSL